MATEKLNFKFGNSEKLSTATITDGDFIAVNESMGVESPTEVEAKLGSIYKGNKILGTTVADKLVTNEEILITEGSPISALGVFTDNKIPAGTSVQDILLKLLCQELYPETKIAASGSFSVTLGNPTITASITSGSNVEAGSSVTISAIKSGKDTISKTAAKVSGFTYGYKDTEDGDLVDADSISSDWTSTASGEYSITASATGFTGLVNTTASGENYAAVTLASQDLKVAAGSNTLTVTATGRSYSATREAIASKFIVSNAGGVSAEHKSQEVAGASSTYSDANGASASYSLTGIYPAYYGAVSSSTPSASDIKAMTKLVKTKQNLVVSGPVENAYMCVACPPGWTITKAIDSNGFDNTAKMVSTTVSVDCLDGTNQTYNVYYIGPTTQAAGFTMTFK